MPFTLKIYIVKTVENTARVNEKRAYCITITLVSSYLISIGWLHYGSIAAQGRDVVAKIVVLACSCKW